MISKTFAECDWVLPMVMPCGIFGNYDHLKSDDDKLSATNNPLHHSSTDCAMRLALRRLEAFPQLLDSPSREDVPITVAPPHTARVGRGW